MFGYIGKLLLSVLGVGSPFIATMYLTNKHKTPTPFLENLEILEMTEIDEQDKLIEEAVAQIKVKKGHSGGGEASDSGGLGSTANSVGSGAKATGESGDIKGGDGNPGSSPTNSQEPAEAAPQPEETPNQEKTGDSQEEGKSNPEQESKNSAAEQTDSQAESHQTQSSSASESNAKDPCEDMSGLINTINKQNSDFSNIAQLIRNASTLKQCIEKQGEAQAQS